MSLVEFVGRKFQEFGSLMLFPVNKFKKVVRREFSSPVRIPAHCLNPAAAYYLSDDSLNVKMTILMEVTEPIIC
jgi:hypothetical protein